MNREKKIGKVKPITEKLATQEKINRTLRLFEKRKEHLRLLIEKLRMKKSGPGEK